MILAALDLAMIEVPERPAVLFSGGLDSGLLAALAKRRGLPRLYTVGVDGSSDLRTGEEAAAQLDLPWTAVVVGEDDVLAACREVLAIVPIDDPVVLSFELPLQMVASRAPEAELVTGQGADELFGGYNRYLAMGPEARGKAMEEDLLRLLDAGVPRERGICAHYGKALHQPFLHPAVREAARSIHPSEMVREGVRKAPLRDAAERLELGPIARREKKAAQYGSGLMNVLKSLARREDTSLVRLLPALARGDLISERYPH